MFCNASFITLPSIQKALAKLFAKRVPKPTTDAFEVSVVRLAPIHGLIRAARDHAARPDRAADVMLW